MNDTPAQRLKALREAMREQAIDAWLLPSSDPHISEYLPAHWQGRQWLSGFTGSVGTLLVSADFAGLWVDSRYFVQAEQELAGSGITMMKVVQGQQVVAPVEWLAAQHDEPLTLGFDAAVVPLAAVRRFSELLGERVTLATDSDLLDVVWHHRPALPTAPVAAHDTALADGDRSDKLAALRRAMSEQSADAHLISSLDDIAWLFNLRGSDVGYNPVFLAHALIEPDSARLFIDRRKVAPELETLLQTDGVTLDDYAAVGDALAALPAPRRLLLDPARVTLALTRRLPEGITLIENIQPTSLAKACKPEAAIAHVREAMKRDGAALCRFLCRFEAALANGETLTELTVDEWLTAEREKGERFVSRSFSTIAGFNDNGALPHYQASRDAHATIQGNGLLLIDSGGQYEDGTTDITRMVPVGRLDDAQRRDCTLVLKGLIALSRSRFPEGIEAPRLDAIARAPLWQAGLDYGHGTGHGVGYYLNVHEGPQVISNGAAPAPRNAMRAGMITSIEPGQYRPGQWGVRIENLVANRTLAAHPGFLEFETLTLCPIDTRCLEPALLNAEEIDWLDAYHARVRETLAPQLDGETREWLEARTRPLLSV
ncbi:aminopeptidase P family protein [Kushneria aurantia]|uniref:Aminopeptidase P family protein n=1 Tax=Kushneria aurantia TaxID=504092 RepID=A0ABV6G2H8_9GAMM|nr:aminopeptidase P family protein [Kushneria aurantia]